MKRIFSLMDLKTGSFNDPMVVPHLAVITRELGEMVKDGKSILSKFPADFALYEVGSFNPESGEVIAESKPKFILNLVELKTEAQNG